MKHTLSLIVQFLDQYPWGSCGHQLRVPFQYNMFLQTVSPTHFWKSPPFQEMQYCPMTSLVNAHTSGCFILEVYVRFHSSSWSGVSDSPLQGHCSVVCTPPQTQHEVTFNSWAISSIKFRNRLVLISCSGCSFRSCCTSLYRFRTGFWFLCCWITLWVTFFTSSSLVLLCTPPKSEYPYIPALVKHNASPLGQVSPFLVPPFPKLLPTQYFWLFSLHICRDAWS